MQFAGKLGRCHIYRFVHRAPPLRRAIHSASNLGRELGAKFSRSRYAR